MKNFKIKSLLAAVLITGFAALAFADPYDFAEKSVKEYPIVLSSALVTGDYVPIFQKSTNRGVLVDASTMPLGGAFNGTVGATTPSSGVFTTLSASSTLGVTGVTTATGGLVSIVTNDFHTPVSAGLKANPVTFVTKGTCTVASVNADTCVILTGATSRTIIVTGFDIVANGGNAGTCTGVLLEDNNDTPVVVATLARATLTSAAHNVPLAATLGVGFGAGTGLTAAKGLQLDVNGSACDTATGFTYTVNYAVQ